MTVYVLLPGTLEWYLAIALIVNVLFFIGTGLLTMAQVFKKIIYFYISTGFLLVNFILMIVILGGK
jgi:hypothetical protein